MGQVDTFARGMTHLCMRLADGWMGGHVSELTGERADVSAGRRTCGRTSGQACMGVYQLHDVIVRLYGCRVIRWNRRRTGIRAWICG